MIFGFVRPLPAYKENFHLFIPIFSDVKNAFESFPINPKILIQYLPYCVLEKKYHVYQDFFAKGKKSDTYKMNIEDVTVLEESIQSEMKYFSECEGCKYRYKCRGIWKEYTSYMKLDCPPLLSR